MITATKAPKNTYHRYLSITIFVYIPHIFLTCIAIVAMVTDKDKGFHYSDFKYKILNKEISTKSKKN